MKAGLLIAVSLFCFLAVGHSGSLGVDVSIFQDVISVDTFKCMLNQGITFVIIEIFNGGYGIGKNAIQSAKNAWAAGMQGVGFYAFMCPNCGGNVPASKPIETIKEHLGGYSDWVRFWIDVEPCDDCWNADQNVNLDYVSDLATAAVNAFGSNKVGLYTSAYCWNAVVGTGRRAHINDLPLWYAHWDGKTDMTDTWAYNFGGWTKGYLKQYTGGTTVCGLYLDNNYLP